MSASSQRSDSESTNFFPGARPFFRRLSNKTGLRALRTNQRDDPNFTGGEIGQSGQEELKKTVQGFYLPGQEGGNPYLDRIANDNTSRSMEAFGQMLKQVNGNAQQAGRLYATKTNLQGQETARRVTDDLMARNNALYGGAYDAERSRMLGAAPTAVNTGDRLLQMIMQIGSVLSGAGTSRSESRGISGGL